MWFGVFGTALRELTIGSVSLPCPVIDSNGKITLDQGHQDDASVLYVGPLLLVQPDGPYVSIDDQIKSSPWQGQL